MDLLGGWSPGAGNLLPGSKKHSGSSKRYAGKVNFPIALRLLAKSIIKHITGASLLSALGEKKSECEPQMPRVI